MKQTEKKLRVAISVIAGFRNTRLFSGFLEKCGKHQLTHNAVTTVLSGF